MRFWLVPLVLILGALIVWWVRRRTAAHYIDWVLTRGAGDPARSARAVTTSQIAALALAVAVLVVAILAEQWNRWFWVRIPLCALVMVAYVPLAISLAPAKVRWQRSATMKVLERGGDLPVAEAVARSGRIYASIGSTLFVVAAIVLSWHHLQTAG